jgi:hypothetical protein
MLNGITGIIEMKRKYREMLNGITGITEMKSEQMEKRSIE